MLLMEITLPNELEIDVNASYDGSIWLRHGVN